jgi:xanthine dehydrogenase small subunit
MVNSRWIDTSMSPGRPALDFIREECGLKGTKAGCREGDCGSCAVLVGEFAAAGQAPGEHGPAGSHTGNPNALLRYRAVPSCLLALGDLAGRHLVTIEGLREATGDAEGLTPVMRAFIEENASQCGFCTPGFIIALSAWLAKPGKPELAGAMTAIDGNLCRCTGYGSIRRAAERLVKEFADLEREDGKKSPEQALLPARLVSLVLRNVLPGSVMEFARTAVLTESSAPAIVGRTESGPLLGGGTDYFVRNPYPEADFSPVLLKRSGRNNRIETVMSDGSPRIRVGSTVSVSDFFCSPLVRDAVPGIERFEPLFASTLVRNLATIGGNIANASPVADMTAMLLGLGAVLELEQPRGRPGTIPLSRFFLGYKTTALDKDQLISGIFLPGPRSDAPLHFSFEKISKRTTLDIAAVNTALSFRFIAGRAREVCLSAGGVAPVPLLLEKASAAMEGESIDEDDPVALARLARTVAEAAAAEASPISDVRGSAEYRKRMLGRLVQAHFLRIFEASGIAGELYP